MTDLNFAQYSFLYNTFSFTFALMMAATLFFWLNIGRVSAHYKTAISITGLVTFIAAYHYIQIFFSFDHAYSVMNDSVTATGKPFNDAYRYVDWLLTVPLLLIELILVMNLSKSETTSRSIKLGLAAALMIVLGYPGEISMDPSVRLFWWALAMIPFVYIVYVLFFGLRKSIAAQPANVKGLIGKACYLTIAAWCFYPIVFLLPNFGLSGSEGYVALQAGYSLADIIAKAGFGLLIYTIARCKSDNQTA